jgi:hypothetical protein
MAVAEDAVDVAAFLAEPPAAHSEPPGSLLVVQADGKGVPMLPAETGAPVGQREVRRKRGQPRGIMREAIVTAVYTLDPTPRRPSDVLTPSSGRSGPRCQTPRPCSTSSMLEHGWEAATGLLGERHPERTAWVRDRRALLLEGHVLDVVADLRTPADRSTLSPTVRALLARTASYDERNAPHMRYDAYLASGWPIGTGVVEGACRHLV